MLPEEAVKLTCPPFPVAWILAVDAVNVPAVLMIDPVVAVTLTAGPLVAPLISALAPRSTLPPAVTVIDPDNDVTVWPITIFVALGEVNNIFLPAVTGALIAKIPPL